jgi:hypothetical protein
MIKDSGERREFTCGAVRDMSEGKGRFDLLPMYGIEAVARVMEEGCSKYGERNWAKGINTHCFMDSALRHLSKFARGAVDEPHLAQAAWNILCLIETRQMVAAGQLPSEFDDIGASVHIACPDGELLDPHYVGNFQQNNPEEDRLDDWQERVSKLDMTEVYQKLLNPVSEAVTMPVANPQQYVNHELCSGFDASCYEAPCSDCDLNIE